MTLRQFEEGLAHINRVSMMGELTASIAHEVNQSLSGAVSNGSVSLAKFATAFVFKFVLDKNRHLAVNNRQLSFVVSAEPLPQKWSYSSLID